MRDLLRLFTLRASSTAPLCRVRWLVKSRAWAPCLRSAPSGYPSSASWVAASSATLLRPMRWLLCCIDQLNPPPKAALSCACDWRDRTPGPIDRIQNVHSQKVPRLADDDPCFLHPLAELRCTRLTMVNFAGDSHPEDSASAGRRINKESLPHARQGPAARKAPFSSGWSKSDRNPWRPKDWRTGDRSPRFVDRNRHQSSGSPIRCSSFAN